MPSPVRRSCHNCVKSKRKCDLGLPKCQRCSQRKISCSYSNELSGRSAARQVAPSNIAPESIPTADGAIEAIAGANVAAMEDFDLSFLPSINMDPEFEWMGPDVNEIETLSLVKAIEEDDSVMSGDIYMPRVRYSVERLKTWPAMFAERRLCPFIHRKTLAVQHSDVLLDVLSACAFYSVKNERNQSAVYEDIRRKAKGLRESSCSSPTELLMKLQAFLMYQIIRLFDGDIRLRAEAEVDAALQTRWTFDLLKHYRPLKFQDDIDSIFNADSTSLSTSSWPFWIFDESVRRVVLTSFLIQGLYSFVRDGIDQVCGKVEKLSFTAQNALWEAPSEFLWKKAWMEKPPFEIRISAWGTDAPGMTIGDCDELGLILEATIDDLDVTSAWIGDANLSIFGLDADSMKKYASE